MRSSILYLLFLLPALNSFAQEYSASIGYQYFYSKQIDEIIKTYNFGTPYLPNKQPLIKNGLSVSASYLYTNKKLKQGILLNYSYFNSNCVNPNYTNTIRLHLIKPGYFLQWKPSAIKKGIYSQLSLSLVTSGLYRYINNQPVLTQNEKVKALGIGVETGLKVGYSVGIGTRHYLSSFFKIALTPYLYSPNKEVVINSTQEMTNHYHTSILQVQLGIAYHLSKIVTEK